MRLNFLAAILIVITGCHPHHNLFEQQGDFIILSDTIEQEKQTENLILPYRKTMDREMDQVIGSLDTTFEQKRTASESLLGNWVADVVYHEGYDYAISQKIIKNDDLCFSLINKGGLRASLNKGPITRGEIYELMPFDNEIVIVKISGSRVIELLRYLFNYQGQPIGNANCQLSSNENKLFINALMVQFNSPVYVITSDYLAKGGDKMYFFNEPLQYFQSGILMRDALLQEVKVKQNIKAPQNYGRIHFVK